MRILYARLMALGVQVMMAPFGGIFIQALAPDMITANATFIAASAADPLDFALNSGNLFAFINTADKH